MVKLLIFGMGYVAQAFTDAYGSKISVIATKSKEHPLHRTFNATQKLPSDIFNDVTHALITIPPINNTDIVLSAHRKELAQIPWLGYLSATSVYGNHDGNTVTEDSQCTPTSKRSLARYTAEQQWHHTFPNKVHIFRLSGIYGPGRSAIDRLNTQQIKECVFAPQYPFSRIHVIDIIQSIYHFMIYPKPGIYNMADALPAPTSDVTLYAAKLLGLQPPPLVPLDKVILSPEMASFYKDRKIVCADKIFNVMETSLTYPTYKEGLAFCLNHILSI